MRKPEMVRRHLLSCQVCVPEDWTFEDAESFANQENPTGISSGWSARKEGSEYLKGDAARTPCDDHVGMIHISFDC